MMMVRRSAALVGLLCAVILSGCAWSRRHTAANSGGPSIAQTSVDSDHLIEVGDLLREQGQVEQAAEMYRLALKRDSESAAAKNRLAQLPSAANPSAGDSPILAPPPPVEVLTPRDFPEASPVQENRSMPITPIVPGEPDADTVPRPYKVTSGRTNTVVQPRANGNDEHVIDIIPATKGRKMRAHQLRVRGERNPENTVARPVPSIRKTSMHSELKLPETQRPRSVRNAEASNPANSVVQELSQLTGYADSAKDHVADIAPRLYHASPRVRALAAFLLGRAGAAAHSQIGPLQKIFETEAHGPTRIRVAEALLRIDPDHAMSQQAIAAGMESSEPAIRWEAVCVAGVMRRHENRETVLTPLLGRLDDGEPRIREMAALVLGDFVLDRVRVVAELESSASRPDVPAEFRQAAAITLAALRSHGGPVWAKRPDEALEEVDVDGNAQPDGKSGPFSK